jgi:hypothetical protein
MSMVIIVLSVAVSAFTVGFFAGSDYRDHCKDRR